MRLIDADALKKLMEEECAEECAICRHANIEDGCCCKLIDNVPTVETTKVEHKAYNEGFKDGVDQGIKLSERPQGEWYYNYQNGWHCSICHEPVKDMPTVMGKADFAFCPNCGAEMLKGGAE